MTNPNTEFHLWEDADACRRSILPAGVCWRYSGSITFRSLFFFFFLHARSLKLISMCWHIGISISPGFYWTYYEFGNNLLSSLPVWPGWGCALQICWGSAAEFPDRSRNESINKNRPWMIFACGKTTPLLRTTPNAEVCNYMPLNN